MLNKEKKDLTGLAGVGEKNGEYRFSYYIYFEFLFLFDLDFYNLKFIIAYIQYSFFEQLYLYICCFVMLVKL